MTTEQQRKILERISKIQADIEILQTVKQQLAASEFVSASLASGGGSKSYTRKNIGELITAINDLKMELTALRKALNGGNFGYSILHIY